MNKKDRFDNVLKWFEKHMPDAKTELNYENTYQLLIAVILSAQCTDKRVNMITPAFFDAFPTPEILAIASVDHVYEYIKSISYPNNKAKNLVGMANMLVEKYNSEVPSTVKELEALPGVGRKTANVILIVAFDKPAMPVDTHVFRVSNRIGFTNDSKTPLETEKTLLRYIPKHLLSIAHHWLILHGRYVCVARKPKCESCGINKYCKYFTGI